MQISFIESKNWIECEHLHKQVITMTGAPLSQEQQDLLQRLIEKAPANAIIGHLTRRLHQAFNSGWSLHGSIDITPPQLLVLTFLSRIPGCDQISLSQACSVDRSTMATLVKFLESEQLLKRSRDPDDRRRWRLDITAQGQAIVDDCSEQLPNINDQVLKNLSAAEIEKLAFLIKKALKP